MNSDTPLVTFYSIIGCTLLALMITWVGEIPGKEGLPIFSGGDGGRGRAWGDRGAAEEKIGGFVKTVRRYGGVSFSGDCAVGILRQHR